MNNEHFDPNCPLCNYDPYKEWKEKTLKAMKVYSEQKKEGRKPADAKYIAYCETGILLW
jgi:hypothetical protein